MSPGEAGKADHPAKGTGPSVPSSGQAPANPGVGAGHELGHLGR